MENLSLAAYAILRQVQRQLARISTMTWVLMLVLIADLSLPGYLRFNFVFAKVDLSGVVDAYNNTEN